MYIWIAGMHWIDLIHQNNWRIAGIVLLLAAILGNLWTKKALWVLKAAQIYWMNINNCNIGTNFPFVMANLDVGKDLFQRYALISTSLWIPLKYLRYRLCEIGGSLIFDKQTFCSCQIQKSIISMRIALQHCEWIFEKQTLLLL